MKVFPRLFHSSCMPYKKSVVLAGRRQWKKWDQFFLVILPVTKLYELTWRSYYVHIRGESCPIRLICIWRMLISEEYFYQIPMTHDQHVIRLVTIIHLLMWNIRNTSRPTHARHLTRQQQALYYVSADTPPSLYR